MNKLTVLETACWAIALLCIGSFSVMKITAASTTEFASEKFIGTKSITNSLPKTRFNDSIIGRLEISRLGIQSAIVNGTSDELLDVGVGRVPGTSYFGIPGNVALAGHRDSFFRNLEGVQMGDEITVHHEAGTSIYVVTNMKVTQPDDTEILKDREGMTVTLITCYPFNFVGSAPQRFIVSAEIKRDAVY